MIGLIQAGHQPLLGDGDLQKILTYAGVGAAWSFVGFANSRAKRGADVETFSPLEAGQTVLIGAICGVVVAMRDQSPNPANFESAMIVAVPFANQIVNMVRQIGTVPAGENGDPQR